MQNPYTGAHREAFWLPLDCQSSIPQCVGGCLRGNMNRFVARLSAGVLTLFGALLPIFAVALVAREHPAQAVSDSVPATRPATLGAATFDNVRQLQTQGLVDNAIITNDGAGVFYDDGTNVFLAITDGLHGYARAVTDVQSGSCTHPRPSADGNLVVMSCTADVTGQNRDGNSEIVLLDLIHHQYSPVTISPTITTPHNTLHNIAPEISADGSSLVFVSNVDWVGRNSAGIDELFHFHDGQYRQVTTGGLMDFSYSYYGPRVTLSDDGNVVGYLQRTGVGGHTWRAYLYDAQTGQTTEPVACQPMVALLFTRDGQSLVYAALPDCIDVPPQPTPLPQVLVYTEQFGHGRRAVPVPAAGLNLDFGTVASNTDGSRIVILSLEDSGLLFTPSGVRPAFQVPSHAYELSLDGAGRTLAFVTNLNCSGSDCPQRHLFVVDIALDSDAPTPTVTPAPADTALPTVTSTPTTVPCTGDCDTGGDVTVNELITLVNIALGNAARSTCPIGDADGSGDITVNEIIKAVGYALGTCPT